MSPQRRAPSPSRRPRLVRRLVAPLLLTSSLVAALLPVLPAQAATTIAKINFQPSTYTTPTGYTADTGLPYTTARGFGWIDQSDSTPLDMTANTRSGNSIPPAYTKVSDMMMQPKGAASGRWEYAIANGTYNVTLTVGDARMSSGTNYCCIDGTMRLSVEGVEVVKDFVASAATPLQTTSANIAVADGKLTVDAVGGINTKFDHIEIATATGPAQGAGPLITGVTPAAGTTGVALNTAVSLAVSAPVDLSTVTAANVKLTSAAGQVAGNYNADAAGGTVSFTPGANLAVNTVYTVTVTSGLKGADGQSFGAFTSTFTTGTAPPPLATTAFSKLMSVSVPKPNVVLIGPDGKLYVGCAGGQIYRFTRAADGSLSSPEVISPFGNRVITGLTFDPVTPTKLWVTNGYAGYTNAPPMSGHVSTLTIAAGQPLTSDVASAKDVIIGLPRSMHDHMTNGLAFGPDGKLYIAQGANTSYGGAPDPYWGARGEAPLTASILMADVDNTSVFPSGSTLDVNTDPVGFTEATGSDTPVGYNPKAAGAQVTVFASGTRNPFTLMWDSNGKLYAPVNESAAGGVTPAGPGNVPVSVSNIQAYTDYFTRVQAGKYYGHPNATQGYYALNGGNPTAAGDPYEVTEYPVGTQPDANWQAPDFAMGVHRSPDGAAEYTNSSAFSGALKGKILVSEYSDGDDIVAFSLDANGKPVSEASLPDATNPGQALIFNNPLGLAVDSTSGVVYVAEHLDETSSALGQVTVIVPSTGGGTVNNGVHVNFQPSTVTTPTGYAADTGAPFNGQTGWQDLSGNPIDLTANTRVAHAASSPDPRYDTDLLMQAPSGSGNTTPGQWATTLPNGSYDVTVAVGDPLATNSVDEIVAQPGTANAVTVIDHFAPTVATPWSTVTKRVQVTNGVLVLSPAGGTNTKIDFVDAVPATGDTLSPSVTLSLAGTLTSGTTYSGPVTVTASAVDNVGVTSTTYVLDGAAAVPYTAPVVVASPGAHTITVTAKDAVGNPGVATKTFTVAAVSTAGSLHVNFAAQTSAAVAGYTPDFGAAFTAAGGGWEDQTTGAPVSAIGNGRDRGSNLSPDKRYDTLVQMQELASSTTGTHTPVRWEHPIANGTYAVTVAVGDATATNSVDKITAEPGTVNSTVIINNFQATSSVLFQTMTKTVTVSDGFLTLSAVGGTNTKLDFVDAVPVDTTPPTAAISLAGPLISGTTYSGTVSATVTAADEAGGSGLVSVLYSVDGGTATPYTTVVPISGGGPHAIAVTAKDGAGNTTTISSSFSITADTIKPTASIDLGGPFDGTDYTGDVTATVTSADTGGSGLASTTYVLDAFGSLPYTDPITVSAAGSHTLTVTATDGAGNFLTVAKTFTIAPAVDTTPPTGSIDLAGSFDGTVYTGDVTATVNAADEVGGSGLAPTTYVLDGAASSATYSAPIVVSAPGDHTLVVTISDLAGHIITLEKDWTSVAAPVDTIDPTVSLDLSGTTGGPGYLGDVTATATYADQGGSGVASVTYALDGASAKPYTAAVVVSAAGDHTMKVTVKDGAGNSASATQTWTSALVDTTDPTVATHLAGTLYHDAVYGGDVTVTAPATDAGSGLATETYVLDGSAPVPYTAAVVVSGTGPHTFTVTATDNQGNQASATATWSQVVVDTTKPTATVDLAGTKSGTTYVGDVKVSLAAADETDGSGLKTATYVLDAAAAKPLTTPVTVSTAGDHTLTLTATDNAGNTMTASQSWTSQLVDGTAPTASIALAGSLYTGTTYGGAVTATVTAADNVGGSGLATVTYVLDAAASTPYTSGITVSTVGPHTLTVTATDNQGNQGTVSRSWTQQTVDGTKPTASVALSGTLGTGGVYTGTVTATVTPADEAGGSGLKTTTYSLDGGATTAYTVPVVVTASGSHSLTVTVTDNAGNVGTDSSAWNQGTSTGTAKLVVTSPDDAVLANPSTPRLVFSAVRSLGATPAKAFTFTNNGTGTLLVSNIAIGGTNASSWKLDTGQATSLSIPGGGTATVSLLFTPTDPTGCASTASPYAIGDVDRNATLTFTTNDSTEPTGSALLSGVNSCYVGGNNEPVLDQLLPELGYTDVVDSPGGDKRYIGALRYLPNTDEIQSPYFTAANAALPVSVIPLAHYGSGSATPYQATGYYAAGSAMTQPKSTCSTACKTLWQFPADTISGGVTTYNQNQKLLPGVTGATTFTGSGTFGFFSGDFSDVNFSDDSLNVGHTTANVDLPVPHYLHDMRVFPAYGPGHVAIPNTYIIGIDLSRVPAYKNNDFQDIVLLVRNVTPALTQGPLPGAATTANLTAAGGTVSASCAVTGFDGVLANTGGTQCNAANIAFTPTGLKLTSTAGQLANSNQQNALYKTFDATHNQFTVTARVLGPLTALTTDYQQIASFFGPDQQNFVKIEAEHNGTGSPHVTMFYSEKGVAGTVATVAVPELLTATTVDLIITGNANLPDPLPYGDTYGVHGFPLDQLTVSYSINGAAPVVVGTAKAPADVTGWFNRQSKAGILVSNSGTTTPIAVTFSRFAITAP